MGSQKQTNKRNTHFASGELKDLWRVELIESREWSDWLARYIRILADTQGMDFKQVKFSDLRFGKIILAPCSEESGLKLTVVNWGLPRLFQSCM